MKIANTDGEWGFKALVHGYCGSPGSGAGSWQLTDGVYFSHEEVRHDYPSSLIKWPVEVMDNQSVYIPDESEWK